jgi:hypothetical protein
MSKYRITMTEIIETSIFVEADNESDAVDIGSQALIYGGEELDKYITDVDSIAPPRFSSQLVEE